VCLRTAETPLHATLLVSALYGALFTRCSGHVSQRIAPSEPKQPRTFAPAASCHSGHLSRAAPSPSPRCFRRAALLASPNLRRRGMTARTFGTEGQHCSDELLLHDKTHITQVTLAFSSNQHCENSPVWTKLRVSRNRQPDRTWTGLPKAIFPNIHLPATGGSRRHPRLGSLDGRPNHPTQPRRPAAQQLRGFSLRRRRLRPPRVPWGPFPRRLRGQPRPHPLRVQHQGRTCVYSTQTGAWSVPTSI
jgi:hypothetical protein